MTRAHWNLLEPGALIFDPVPSRAPTIFALHTRAGDTWYHPKPEWEALYQSPDLVNMRAAGFRYLYLDNRYWDETDPRFHPQFDNGCALLLDEFSDSQGNFRRLFDLKNCE
jgi:hypothetical protein